MRFLDRGVAGAACALVSPLAWVLRRLGSHELKRPLPRILCLKFFGLGSLVRAAPLFLSVRKSNPDAQLCILTFKENRPLLERFNVFDRILTVDTSSTASMVVDLLKAVVHLGFNHYDAVIDMEFFSNFSTLLAFLTNAPIRAGFYLQRSFRERVLTKIVYYNSSQHISDGYMALARSVGALDAGDPSRIQWVRDEDRSSLERLLQSHGLAPGEKRVVINVNASDLCLERRWSPERFADLCRQLRAETGHKLLFIGAKSQREYVQSVVTLTGDPACINLAGETDFGMLLALLERADVLIGNDSGPIHLAEALGAPIVALYGPESPVHYGLRTTNSATFYLGLYCSPCLTSANVKVAPCKGKNICLQHIPVKDVLRASLLLLKKEPIPAEEAARWNGYGGKFTSCDWLHPPATPD
jgi:ADP-heptose:LPS heptosyltransferase